MSDLLDSLRAVNPVPSCEQPSIHDVWRKLEQQDTRPVSRRSVRPATRGWRSSLALSTMAAGLAAAVVLVIAGRHASVPPGAFSRAAPSAAVRRLVNGTITCDFTSVHTDSSAAVVSTSAQGRSAIVYCRNRYRAMAHAGTVASGMRLIACQTSATNVAVYIADGRPDQCGRLGDRALPAGYTAAVRRSSSQARATSDSGGDSALSV